MEYQIIRINFSQTECGKCINKSDCISSTKKARAITVRPEHQHNILEKYRKNQLTEDFKNDYSIRAGVEGTLSEGVRVFELRKCRYKGLAKTKLQHLITGAAMNLVRINDWLAGKRFKPRNEGPFVQLLALKAA
jgi:transposase